MPRRRWAARLGGCLPRWAERDLFTPALADLDADRADLDAASPAAGPRSWIRLLGYASRVLGIYVECVRLAALDSLLSRWRVVPAPPPPRKEFLAMVIRDIRHALRIFRREPAFAAAAVLTLTLGIGANTALFAVVEAVLLRPLPFREASDLMVVRHRDLGTGLSKSDIAIGDFVDLAARQQSFETLAGYSGFQSTLLGLDQPIRVEGLTVSPSLLATLGIEPAMGRGFEADDVREQAVPVVIISHELWRTTLGSDPAILSRSLQVGSTRRLVVGVAPAGFRFPAGNRTDVLVPARIPPVAPEARKSGWMYGVGRLRPGVTADAAAAEFAALSRQFELEFPRQNQGSQYYTLSLRDAAIGETKRPLLLLLGAVGFVLLIACANVGNLLLARSLARQQELSMRLALGAGRSRLAGQILTEGLVLGVAGGAAGVAFAWPAAPALAALMPQAAGIPGLDAVGINGSVLAFSVAASIVAAVAFSGIACLSLTRDGARHALAGPRRATMTAGARRAASSLVAVEIALAVVLLIGAGLTLRTFANLMAVDPGFRTERVLAVNIGLPPGRYADAAARHAFYAEAFAAIENVDAVEAVGAAAVVPLTGNNWTVPLARPEHPVPDGQRPPEVGWQAASPGYFEALQIPLKAGRVFDATDTPQSRPVVVISDAAAQRYFPGEHAVGKRVLLGRDEVEIVGIVGSIRRATLSEPPREDMYFPFTRQPGNGITLFIRTTGDPLAAWPAIRTSVHQLEPNAVLFDVRTLEDIAAESAGVARLAMTLLGGFAVLALVLSAVGIYGVMTYSVRRRTRELGTRLALGARRADIVALVLREAAVIAAAGLAMGVATGLALAQALSAILYGVPSWDPPAVVAAATLLVATALAASYLPARRASRLDPARTLAAE